MDEREETYLSGVVPGKEDKDGTESHFFEEKGDFDDPPTYKSTLSLLNNFCIGGL